MTTMLTPNASVRKNARLPQLPPLARWPRVMRDATVPPLINLTKLLGFVGVIAVAAVAIGHWWLGIFVVEPPPTASWHKVCPQAAQ